MRSGRPSPFFTPVGADPKLQEERLHWLDQNPERCLAEAKQGAELLEQCADLAAQWTGSSPSRDEGLLAGLAKFWETDFLLLNRQDFTLAAGCVCLPSSWSLQDSIGKTLTEIHGRVPELNPSIGSSIERFLGRLPPDRIFYRENWSLTRSGDLNYHPDLQRPKLCSGISESELFFRIEHQAFAKLPDGVLMGIRIEPIPITDLSQDTAFLQNLHQQLATMPAAVAIYKSLHDGIPRILEILEDLIKQRDITS